MTYPVIEFMFNDENPKSVFEVGVNDGKLIEDKPWVIGGIDISSTGIIDAKLNHPQYADNFVCFNATQPNWPIPDESYDIVFTCGTLLLIPDPFIVIKEMLRIAKDKIIIAELHDDKLDEYGSTTRQIKRNYNKVFKILNLKAIYTGHINGKDIFKCQKITNLQ